MSSVFLTEVDDFLETSQACINPLFTTTTTTSATTDPSTTSASAVPYYNDDQPSIHLDLGGEGGENVKLIKDTATNSSSSTNIISKGGQRIVQRGSATRRRRPQRGKIQIAAVTNKDKINYGETSQGLGGDNNTTASNSNRGNADMVESNLIQSSGQNQKATVSVADCLACSGCVTSAEAVLVNNHSLATLKRNCYGSYGTYNGVDNKIPAVTNNEQREDPTCTAHNRMIAFTISPAVLVELVRLFVSEEANDETSHNSNNYVGNSKSAQRVNTTSKSAAASNMFLKLVTLLHHKLGAALVVDGQSIGDISLLESAEEFVQRYRKEAARKKCKARTTSNAQNDVGDITPLYTMIEQKEVLCEDEKKEEEGKAIETSSFMAEESSTKDKNKRPHFVPLPLNVKDQTVHRMPSMALSATKTRYIRQNLESDDNNFFNTGGGSDGTNTTDAFEVMHSPGRRQQNPPQVETRINHCKDQNIAQLISSDEDKASTNNDEDNVLPLLSSSCPGFVCYVEKTAPYAIPHLSSAKSQMALSGYIIKHIMVPSSSKQWYHIAIMPCHDKKLEASRKDLAWESVINDTNPNVIPDVDLVITTSELLELILEWATAENGVNDDMEMEDHVTTVTNRTSAKINSSSSNLRSFMNKVKPSSLLSNTEQRNANDALKVIARSCHVPSSLFGEGTTSMPTKREVSLVYSSAILDCCDGSNTTATIKEVTEPSSCQRQQKEHQQTSTTLHPLWGSIIQTSSSGSSGGYADFLFRYAAWNLFKFEIPPSQALPWKSTTLSFLSSSSSMITQNSSPVPEGGSTSTSFNATTAVTVEQRRRRPPRKRELNKSKNGDLRVVTLYYYERTHTFSMDGQTTKNMEKKGLGIPVLTFATAYGFKNIQGILQQLKTTTTSSKKSSSISSDESNGGKCDFHYVEVMACPSGCLNGGGQVRSLDVVAIPPSVNVVDQDMSNIESSSIASRRETPTEKRERLTKSHKILDSRPLTLTNDQTMSRMLDDRLCSDVVGKIYQQLRKEKMKYGSIATDNKKDSSSFLESQQQQNIPKHHFSCDEKNEGESISGVFNDVAQKYFHTRYHIVPRLELTSGAVSGVALSHTKW